MSRFGTCSARGWAPMRQRKSGWDAHTFQRFPKCALLLVLHALLALQRGNLSGHWRLRQRARWRSSSSLHTPQAICGTNTRAVGELCVATWGTWPIERRRTLVCGFHVEGLRKADTTEAIVGVYVRHMRGTKMVVTAASVQGAVGGGAHQSQPNTSSAAVSLLQVPSWQQAREHIPRLSAALSPPALPHHTLCSCARDTPPSPLTQPRRLCHLSPRG